MSLQQVYSSPGGQFGRRLPVTAPVQVADELLRRREPSTSDRIRSPFGESRCISPIRPKLRFAMSHADEGESVQVSGLDRFEANELRSFTSVAEQKARTERPSEKYGLDPASIYLAVSLAGQAGLAICMWLMRKTSRDDQTLTWERTRADGTTEKLTFTRRRLQADPPDAKLVKEVAAFFRVDPKNLSEAFGNAAG
jgi:hypothetical protein